MSEHRQHPRRLPRVLRRREAERRRVEAFLAAIRATAPRPPEPPVRRPLPPPRVEPVETPRGRVWRLDEASRARLGHTDTAELPRIVATASAPLGREPRP